VRLEDGPNLIQIHKQASLEPREDLRTAWQHGTLNPAVRGIPASSVASRQVVAFPGTSQQNSARSSRWCPRQEVLLTRFQWRGQTEDLDGIPNLEKNTSLINFDKYIFDKNVRSFHMKFLKISLSVRCLYFQWWSWPWSYLACRFCSHVCIHFRINKSRAEFSMFFGKVDNMPPGV